MSPSIWCERVENVVWAQSGVVIEFGWPIGTEVVYQFSLLRIFMLVASSAALFALLKLLSPSLPPAVFALLMLAVAFAAASHAFCRRFWRASMIAAVAASFVFVVSALYVVRADGWAGWPRELPHIVRAFAICFVMSLGISALVGIPFYTKSVVDPLNKPASHS